MTGPVSVTAAVTAAEAVVIVIVISVTVPVPVPITAHTGPGTVRQQPKVLREAEACRIRGGGHPRPPRGPLSGLDGHDFSSHQFYLLECRRQRRPPRLTPLPRRSVVVIGQLVAVPRPLLPLAGSVGLRCAVQRLNVRVSRCLVTDYHGRQLWDVGHQWQHKRGRWRDERWPHAPRTSATTTNSATAVPIVVCVLLKDRGVVGHHGRAMLHEQRRALRQHLLGQLAFHYLHLLFQRRANRFVDVTRATTAIFWRVGQRDLYDDPGRRRPRCGRRRCCGVVSGDAIYPRPSLLIQTRVLAPLADR